MKLITKPTLRGWKYIAFIVVVISFIQPLSAQQKLPIIKATSKIVDVKDGEVYQKGIWNLSPENKPDIYFALEPVHEKKITFYTDIDSISFDIIPDSNYNFIILLNSKDTCYTQITTIKPPQQSELNTASLSNIEPELLKQDFTFFRETLEKEHAGLYRYKSKIVLDKLFDSCFTTLNHPVPQLEFAKSIAFVISSIEDGHTGTNLSRLLMNYYGENEKMFPVYVYFINRKAYVLCSSIKELPAETEILSIDYTPISEIKKKTASISALRRKN